MKRNVIIGLMVVACIMVLADVGFAQSANPWEKPLTDISTSMMGPVALAGFLIALGIFCLMWMMGAHVMGLVIGLVVGGAILGNAESIASWLGIGG